MYILAFLFLFSRLDPLFRHFFVWILCDNQALSPISSLISALNVSQSHHMARFNRLFLLMALPEASSGRWLFGSTNVCMHHQWSPFEVTNWDARCFFLWTFGTDCFTSRWWIWVYRFYMQDGGDRRDGVRLGVETTQQSYGCYDILVACSVCARNGTFGSLLISGDDASWLDMSPDASCLRLNGFWPRVYHSFITSCNCRSPCCFILDFLLGLLDFVCCILCVLSLFSRLYVVDAIVVLGLKGNSYKSLPPVLVTRDGIRPKKRDGRGPFSFRGINNPTMGVVLCFLDLGLVLISSSLCEIIPFMGLLSSLSGSACTSCGFSL